MTSSLLIKILKIDKFGVFSSDIDYNSRPDIFRDDISLIINQCHLQATEGSLWRTQRVRQPRSASKRSALALTTGWLISSDTSFFRYKIYYTRTILVIMVFRDCNSNILNGFRRFFESKTWNCVLYGEFYGGKCVLARSKNRESRSQLL